SRAVWIARSATSCGWRPMPAAPNVTTLLMCPVRPRRRCSMPLSSRCGCASSYRHADSSRRARLWSGGIGHILAPPCPPRPSPAFAGTTRPSAQALPSSSRTAMPEARAAGTRSGKPTPPARCSPIGRRTPPPPDASSTDRPAMSFSAELWQSITPIYAAILDHPFVRGLTDGSLPREAFRFYAVQDALYLRDFARALSIAAARAPQDDWIIMFNEHAAGALKVERALHESFFAEWGLTPEAVAATPLAPTNQAYTSYLLAAAYGAPFHEAVAALLPCYWIYWEVGKALERTGSADALYTRWIGT